MGSQGFVEVADQTIIKSEESVATIIKAVVELLRWDDVELEARSVEHGNSTISVCDPSRSIGEGFEYLETGSLIELAISGPNLSGNKSGGAIGEPELITIRE